MAGNRNNNRRQAGNGAGNSQRRAGNTARRRPGGGVPPLDAFDETKKRRPPNLPGQPGFDPGQGNPGGKASAGQSAARQGGERQMGGRTAAPKRAGKAGGGSGKKNGRATQPAKRRPKKRVSPARRRRRRFLAVFFTALVLIGAGVLFSFRVLFKIDNYVINGETGYTQEEIVQAFGYDVGENMFSFNAGSRAATMQQTLPYLENLRIKRKLPGTVVFEVTQAVETYTVQTNGQYAVLSESLKVLRMADSEPEGLVQLYGLSDLSAQPGYVLSVAIGEEDSWNPYQELPGPPEIAQNTEPEEGDPDAAGEGEGEEGDGAEGTETEAETEGSEAEEEQPPAEGEEPLGDEEGGPGEGEDEGEAEDGEPEEPPAEEEPAQRELTSPHERFAAMLELIALLDNSELTDITWLDVTDTLNLRFCWEDRITVILGARSALEEKLRVAIVMMTDREQSNIGENERGTIDVSTYTTTLKGYFTPE